MMTRRIQRVARAPTLLAMITHSHSDFGAGINLTRRLLLRRYAAAHMTLEWDCDVVASAQHRLFLKLCCCILKYMRKEKKK